MKQEFWHEKSLDGLDREEWEALCDGCGRCCLHKLEDEDSGEVHYTNVACRLLDLDTCRCGDYAQRRLQVPDCVPMTPEFVNASPWLPSTCAYRLRAEGRPLPAWHPLRSGDPDSVHRAGIAICGRAVQEDQADDLEEHIIHLQC